MKNDLKQQLFCEVSRKYKVSQVYGSKFWRLSSLFVFLDLRVVSMIRNIVGFGSQHSIIQTSVPLPNRVIHRQDD